MSRNSLSSWRDSIHLSWEKLHKFFTFFRLKFNPTTFIRSRRFSHQERYIFFNYISSCLKIENSTLEMDLGMIDMDSIYDYLALNKHTYAYHFFYYNNLFPEDYEYEDMQYEPFIESVPVFLEAFEFGVQDNGKQDKKRQMNLAFNLDEDQKEKYDVKIPGEVEDPMMKLDLKTMKPATGIFLGRLKITDRQEHYNIRIDFYKHGKKPILEIKI